MIWFEAQTGFDALARVCLSWLSANVIVGLICLASGKRFRGGTTNRHHADLHSNPNDMMDVDLIEMVCDWTAMSQEFQQYCGSARGWADKTIGHRLKLNNDWRDFVYRMIELLDANLDGGPE